VALRKGDCFEIAAADAFHLAEAQSFLDGNKRTAIAAALAFLAMNGRRQKPGNFDLLQLHDAMIKVADHKLARTDLAKLMRLQFMGSASSDSGVA
jgi:death on curing protein